MFEVTKIPVEMLDAGARFRTRLTKREGRVEKKARDAETQEVSNVLVYLETEEVPYFEMKWIAPAILVDKWA